MNDAVKQPYKAKYRFVLTRYTHPLTRR